MQYKYWVTVQKVFVLPTQIANSRYVKIKEILKIFFLKMD